MDKKVLIICTGNSCRSIIAEALINRYLDGVEAYSCGVAPSGRVNPNAKRVLEENLTWRDEYYSKDLDEVMGIDFDLVVTVCDHAKETCPIFPKGVPIVHIGFVDPDGKEYSAFKETYRDIKETLLPKVEEILNKKDGEKMQKNLFKTDSGVKISFKGVVQKQQIVKMVENCKNGQCECMSDETKRKITDMKIDGKDGDVELNLSGNISKEEIAKALAKSKVLK
jgi:arsenate reductase